MKTLLWLDDCRDPFASPDWIMRYSPIGDDVDIVWCKSYNEFVDYLNQPIPLPDAICFDHDLGEPGTNGKTGYDCAKFLISMCQNMKLKLPAFNSQSSNPVGRENIISLLNNFKKFQ